MKVMITGSKDPLSVASFWYKEHIGEVFEVTEDPNYSEYYLTVNPIHKEHQGHIKKVDCILVLDVSPQAIETTEILNEVKADKGILTEEELKETVSYIKRNRDSIYKDVAHSLLENIEKSHRELFKANAELSFKNQNNDKDITKLANLLKEIIPHIHDIVVLDMIQPVLIEMFEKRAKDVLKNDN